MHRNTIKAIESHLDQQLGVWTRLLPWRHELAIHLQEAYESSNVDASAKEIDATAWRHAFANFGSVPEVARQLRKEHRPSYLGWRITVIFVSVLVVFTASNPSALIGRASFGFAMLPAIALLCFDAFQGSTRWALASRLGIAGCACGAMIGLASILMDWNSPSRLGSGMGLSILSALYCTLFFTPSRKMIFVLLGIVVVEFALMLVQFEMGRVAQGGPAFGEMYWSLSWRIDQTWGLRILSFLGCGVSLGIARFGLHGVARHAFSVGAAVFLVSLIAMLQDMSELVKTFVHFLAALAAMTVAVVLSHCVSNSSRIVMRFLR